MNECFQQWEQLVGLFCIALFGISGLWLWFLYEAEAYKKMLQRIIDKQAMKAQEPDDA